LFNPEAAKSNIQSSSFSSGASELLSLLAVLGHYFLVVSSDTRPANVQSFMALVDVAQLVFAVGECEVDPDTLERLIQGHLQLYVGVYGADSVLPKHNYCLMFPDQLRRFGTFVRAFVHERHHMLLKKIGYHRKNNRLSNWG